MNKVALDPAVSHSPTLGKKSSLHRTTPQDDNSNRKRHRGQKESYLSDGESNPGLLRAVLRNDKQKY
jgi:hypothetical protein